MYKKDIKHLKTLFTQLKLPSIIKLEAPKSNDSVEEAIFQEEIKQHIKDKKYRETTLASLYNVVCGQCSKLLQNKLKSRPRFVTMDDTSNAAISLTEIKTYVDDTKISYEYSKVVDWVISELEHEFGKMTVTCGSKHTFVGIDDKEFNTNGTVTLSMDEYVQECIKLHEGEIQKSAATPAKGDPFDSDEVDNAIMLDEEKADKFHHTTAILLYAVKRVRIDIDLQAKVSIIIFKRNQTDEEDYWYQ